MDPQANSKLHILAMLVLLLMWAWAGTAQAQVNDMGQCLTGCGQDIVTCTVRCVETSKGLPELAQCIEGCGATNFSCMGKCTGMPITVPSPPPPNVQ
ncbi:conserved hypothetical protein [Ricinus communis]|uniref:Uncharacterized protein n=1 Tax=Ricinus communis TaxID=3988 RepID=B9RGV6_RICCO|nr:conserved hypothetical protein [Ricinus communis]